MTGEKPKPAPTADELEQWEQEAKQQQQQRDARRLALVQEHNAEKAKRARHRGNWVAEANQLESARKRSLLGVVFRGAPWAPPTAHELDLRWKAEKVLDLENFVFENGELKPVTELGAAQQAAWKEKREAWEAIDRIDQMAVGAKLLEPIRIALDEGLIQGEIREQLAELITPANVAIMAGVMGAIGASTFTPIGPFVPGVVTVIGYVLTGKTVLDVTYDLYMYVTCSLGARSPEDFRKAAEHFKKGVATLVVEGGQAAATVGAGRLLGMAKAGEAGKKAVKARADGKLEADVGAAVPALPPKPGKRGRTGQPGAVAELAEATAALLDKLRKALGKDVLEKALKNVKDDPEKLAETLGHLDTIVENAKKNTTMKRPRQLHNDEKVGATLQRILTNEPLKKAPPELLLADLAKVADLDGFVSTMKRLKKTDESVKGVLAEFILAAKDRRAGKQLVDINKNIVHPELGPTDIDIVSDLTFWQVKVGKDSYKSSSELEKLLRQAVQIARQEGVCRVGFRMDPEAARRFLGDGSGTNVDQQMWSRIKNEFPEIEFRFEQFTFPYGFE